MTIAQQQQTTQTAQTVAEELAAIGRTLDTLTENILNMMQTVNTLADEYGWGDGSVRRGVNTVEEMQREEERLRERRRRLWGAATQPQPRAS